jgi:outer membrane protein assembly factor BamB
MLATTLVGLAALAVGGGPSEAQLATSGWPMLGSDQRHSGQSALLGPKFNGVAPGTNDVRSTTFYDKIKMFPTVGPDGSIYVGMGWQFCAINPLDVTNPDSPMFTQRWCHPTNADVSASGAAIDKDGYVYFGDRDNSIYKLRGSDGARMWTRYTYLGNTVSLPAPPDFRFNSYSNCHEGDHNASPTIAPDGTIYFAFTQNCDGNGSIMAVKNTSATTFNIKWKVGVGQFATFSSPALTTDPNDGKPVIVMGFSDSSVRGIKDKGACTVHDDSDPTPPPSTATCGGAVLWKTTIGIGSIFASPVLSQDGTTAYVGGSGGMYALNAVTGQLKWTFPTTPAKVDSTAAMSNNGILYFVSRNSNARTVYAIDPAPLNAKTNPTPQDFQNAVQWTYGPTTAAQSTEGGFPIIGADGIVYVGMANGVYALQPNSGQLLWKYLTQNGIISAPALGLPAPCSSPPPPSDPNRCDEATANQSGTAVLYIGSVDHNVYAIKSPRTGLTDNQPPNAQLTISPSQQVPAGTDVTFDASASTDPNGDPLAYKWNLGDGNTPTTTVPVIHHTYWSSCGPPNTCNGTAYPISLTVNDGLADSTPLLRNLNVMGGGLSYFCDGFNRGPSSTLGSPGSGSALGSPCPPSSSLQWEEEQFPPSIATSMSVNGTQLINDPIKTTHMATVSAYAGADQVVATDFTSTYNGTAPRFGILLRFIDPRNYYVAYRWVGGASVLRISKVVNGVETLLSQNVPVPNPDVNVPFRLRASVKTTPDGSGAVLALRLCASTTSCTSGTTATVTVPSSPFSGGGVGLQLMWSTSTAPSYIMDNFKACVGGPQADCSLIEPIEPAP